MSALIPVYRRQATALHAARATVSALFCCALALVPVLYENPIVLGGALLAVLGAGSLAGVGRQLRRAMWIALGFAAGVRSLYRAAVQSGKDLEKDEEEKRKPGGR